MAVIAAFELDDLRRPGEAAREAQRRHRRFGAGRHEPHHLERRQPRGRASRRARSRARSARRTTGRARPSACTARTTAGCAWPRIAGPPRADVVDVALAVGVPQVRAFAAREEARRAADRAKRAHRRIDAGGNRALRAREQLFVAAHPDRDCERRRLRPQATRRSRAAARVIAAGSSCANTSEMTATASAPASISTCAFAAVMPPIATTGTPSVARSAQQRDVGAPRCGLRRATRRSCRTRRSRRRPRRRARARSTVVVARNADQRDRRRRRARAVAIAASSSPRCTPSASTSAASADVVVDDEQRAVARRQPRERAAPARSRSAASARLVAVLDAAAPPSIAARDLARQQLPCRAMSGVTA